MYGRSFVCQRGQKSSTTTVTAGTFNTCCFVDLGKRLRQTVCAEASLDAFLTRENLRIELLAQSQAELAKLAAKGELA